MICFPHSLQSINIIAIIIPHELSDLKTWILRRWEYRQNLNYTPAFLKLIFFFIYILNVFSNARIGYLLLYSALSGTCCRYQQIYYSSPMIQKAMTLMVRTYPKKRLFVEFV